jgi:hypothetical protein
MQILNRNSEFSVIPSSREKVRRGAKKNPTGNTTRIDNELTKRTKNRGMTAEESD